MRPRVPIEAFDPATLWPVRLFDSFTSAEAAGFKHANIAACISGKRQRHGDYGWRKADALSRLPEFVRIFCEVGPGFNIDRGEFLRGFGSWAGKHDAGRLMKIMEARFPPGWVDGPVIRPRNSDPFVSLIWVFRGLRWAGRPHSYLD